MLNHPGEIQLSAEFKIMQGTMVTGELNFPRKSKVPFYFAKLKLSTTQKLMQYRGLIGRYANILIKKIAV